MHGPAPRGGFRVLGLDSPQPNLGHTTPLTRRRQDGSVVERRLAICDPGPIWNSSDAAQRSSLARPYFSDVTDEGMRKLTRRFGEARNTSAPMRDVRLDKLDE